jgi:hypothetical protein
MKRKIFSVLTAAMLLSAVSLSLSKDAFAAPFTDNGNGTVTDQRTGLMWQQGEPGSMTWGAALVHCEGLSLGGHTDWRLPNVKELESITDDARYNPAIDTTYFPNAQASDYWSSTTYASYPDYAWHVHFYGGGVGAHYAKDYDYYYVRCVRAGQSESFGNLVISPSSYDFGNVDVGGSSVMQTFTVTNNDSVNAVINSVSITGADPSDFWVQLNGCLNMTLPSSGTCTVQIVFSPASYGLKEATLGVTAGSLSASSSLKGTGGPTGTSTVGGTVYNEKGNPLSGATVQIGGNTRTTGSDGKFLFTNMSSGSYTATAGKTGYSSAVETLNVPPFSSVTRNFTLFPASSDLKVLSITSKYSGFIHYLYGTDFFVTYTANVNWGNHPPGKVRFIASKGTYDVSTSGSTASKEFNTALEFQPCSTLQVVAISSDGAHSSAKSADFTIMSPILGGLAFSSLDIGDGFYYKTSVGFNLKFIDEGIADGTIPADIPLFGSHGFNLRLIPTVESTIRSNGQVEIGLDWENKPLVKGKLAGFEYSLKPKVDINGEFTHPGCNYKWSGSAGLKGEVGISKSWPFIFMAGPVPVPMYAKAGFKLSTDATLVVEAINPVKVNGQVGINPYAKGSLGAGVDELLAVEGWIGGGADWKLQYPQKPVTKELSIYLNGGVTIYALLWKWENEALKWDWLLDGTSGPVIADMNTPVRPRLVSRAYLDKKDFNNFIKSGHFLLKSAVHKGESYAVAISPLQLSVFPYSEPDISSAGNAVSLLWVSDEASRTDINRTMAVFSSYDGAAWSSPAAISDDGTADFHPYSVTFSDGTVIAAWEDEKAALPDTATFDNMVHNLEISAAVYDPTAKIWQAQRMTSNGYLDRSPKLSGISKNDVMLIWISNEDDGLSGSSNSVNKLWYSLFNGTTWSALQTAAEIPYGLVKYSLAYDVTEGKVLLSLDTDDDPATITDHELFSLSYSGGSWGTLMRLTNDTVADDNPQLAVNPNGDFVLTWLRGSELSSALNFDIANRTIIRTDEYSSNLADFKLASSSDGKLALVWAEPSEFSSDLFAMFYDPIFDIWGSPKQLTVDTETERHATAAFYGNETLIAVYNRNIIGQTQVTRPTAGGKIVTLDVPTQIGTDLYMLKYTMGEDLALEAGSLTSSPLNPEPGNAAVLSVKAMNSGDKPLSDAVVAFYLGDPLQGGTKIGETTISGVLKPGDMSDVSLDWSVPQTDVPLTLFAVIDPSAALDPVNRANNTTSAEMIKPDLTIQTINWEWLTDNILSVTARVMNAGPISSIASTVKFRKDTASGQLLSSQNVKALAGYESADVNLVWDVSEISKTRFTVNIVVDEENAVNEFSEDNNEKPVTASKTCDNAFDDVPSGYWAGDFVTQLACSSITSGCGGGNFCPDNTVTRAQMAVFLVKSMGETPASSCEHLFSDVDETTGGNPAFCKYIEKFSTLGITAGCGGSNFCPNDPVTRAQMAVFLTKALGETMASTCGGTFNDVDETTGGNPAFCKFIEKFATLGITAGCGNDNYCPDSPVTRAQMAVFLTKGFLQ